MLTSRRRLLAACTAAVGLAAAVTLAVRLPGDAERSAVADVRAAPGRLRAAHRFRLALRLRLVGSDGTVHATTASAALDPDDERAQATIPDVLGRPDLQLVAQGPILYLSVPQDRREAVGGARWVRVDAGSHEAAAGARLGPLPGPVAVVDVLGAATSPVRRLPMGEGNGRAWRVHLDLERLPHTPDGLEVYRAFIALGRQLDADVRLDRHGRLASVALTATLRDGSRLDVGLSAGAIGAPLEIGVPPDSTTVPAPSVTEALLIAGATPP